MHDNYYLDPGALTAPPRKDYPQESRHCCGWVLLNLGALSSTRKMPQFEYFLIRDSSIVIFTTFRWSPTERFALWLWDSTWNNKVADAENFKGGHFLLRNVWGVFIYLTYRSLYSPYNNYLYGCVLSPSIMWSPWGQVHIRLSLEPPLSLIIPSAVPT